MKRKLTVIAAIAISFLAGLTGAAPSRASAILGAASDTVHVGDIFTIPISISGSTGITSFQFDLSFNPTIIKALSFDDSSTAFATEASNEGGSLTGITGFIDNSAGLLSGVADSMSGAFGAGLTDGTVADITFQALSVGSTPLHLSNAFLNFLDTTNGGFILQDGLVTVLGPTGGGTVPEPGTLSILLAALSALGASRLLSARRNRSEPLRWGGKP